MIPAETRPYTVIQGLGEIEDMVQRLQSPSQEYEFQFTNHDLHYGFRLDLMEMQQRCRDLGLWPGSHLSLTISDWYDREYDDNLKQIGGSNFASASYLVYRGYIYVSTRIGEDINNRQLEIMSGKTDSAMHNLWSDELINEYNQLWLSLSSRRLRDRELAMNYLFFHELRHILQGQNDILLIIQNIHALLDSHTLRPHDTFEKAVSLTKPHREFIEEDAEEYAMEAILQIRRVDRPRILSMHRIRDRVREIRKI